MKPPKIYKYPGAFQAAFERRHGNNPRALLIIMERFAARVCAAIDGAVIKGGLGLELRLETARTTKDADMIISAAADLEARLSRAGELDFGDFMKFVVKPGDASDFHVPGMVYPGLRYTIQALFASGCPPWPIKPYRTFYVEIDIRGPVEFDVIYSRIDGFIQPQEAPIRIYGLHEQIAEKVHAYTDSRHRDTDIEKVMRPRDLLDLCRCAASSRLTMDAQRLRTSLEAVFATRKAAANHLHDLPPRLPEMPASWQDSFTKTVSQSQLPWRDPTVAHQLASEFINPVLAGTAAGTWNPTTKRWQ